MFVVKTYPQLFVGVVDIYTFMTVCLFNLNYFRSVNNSNAQLILFLLVADRYIKRGPRTERLY